MLTDKQKEVIERLRRMEESLPRERYADMPQWLQMQWLFERQNERITPPTRGS